MEPMPRVAPDNTALRIFADLRWVLNYRITGYLTKIGVTNARQITFINRKWGPVNLAVKETESSHYSTTSTVP
jgi:hypothetical protein